MYSVSCLRSTHSYHFILVVWADYTHVVPVFFLFPKVFAVYDAQNISNMIEICLKFKMLSTLLQFDTAALIGILE